MKPLRAEKTPELPMSEPQGFRCWFQREYPKAAPDTPFDSIPLDIRNAFQPL